MEEEKYDEIKKFKDDFYSRLETVINKEKNLKEREDNLNKISMDRRAQRNEGNIVAANRIHREEYMPLYEENEELKKEISDDKASIDELIKEQEDLLKEKENEFNELSRERRKLRDEDKILEANQLHTEKINPLYEEIEAFRSAIMEMKELQEKNNKSNFEEIEENVVKYNNERRKAEEKVSLEDDNEKIHKEDEHYERLAKELEEQAKRERAIDDDEDEAIKNFERLAREGIETSSPKKSIDDILAEELADMGMGAASAEYKDKPEEGSSFFKPAKDFDAPAVSSRKIAENKEENAIPKATGTKINNDTSNNNNAKASKSVLDGKNYKITIGSEGKIKRGTSTYTIAPIYFKEGASLNESYKNMPFDKFKDLVKEKYSPEIITMIENAHKNSTPIDFTILTTINSVSSIPELEKEELIKGYLTSMLGKQYADIKANNPNILVIGSLKEYENAKKPDNMSIVYDLKDLSKPVPFWKTLLSFKPEAEQLTMKEKETIAELADKSKEYGIGEKKGEFKYKTSILTKILGLFNKNKNLLPAPWKDEVSVEEEKDEKDMEEEKTPDIKESVVDTREERTADTMEKNKEEENLRSRIKVSKEFTQPEEKNNFFHKAENLEEVQEEAGVEEVDEDEQEH